MVTWIELHLEVSFRIKVRSSLIGLNMLKVKKELL